MRWLKVILAVAGLGACAVGAAAVGAWVLFPFPADRLDRWPTSPVVTDRNGREMLLLTAADEQWRLPVSLDRMSPWLVKATVAIEDRRFYRHHGVDPLAVGRAARQNLGSGRVVSGASTLTMQICRMMDNRPRSFSAKLVEAFRAAQLERIRDKNAVLEMYLNTAPYGRNYRGVEAAARAYFGKSAANVSLGEAALLAGLPQSPSRYRPDMYPDRARLRRDVVLARMAALGMITQEQRMQAAGEEIGHVVCQSFHPHPTSPLKGEEPEPETPSPSQGEGRGEGTAYLSRFVPDNRTPLPPSTQSAIENRQSKIPIGLHAAFMALARRPAGGRTTIDLDIQAEVERLAADHAPTLPHRSDLAVVVIDVPAGDIRALMGSVDFANPRDGQVNGATARRSPGSALKPFIYAAAFESRRLGPQSTVYDIPIERAGWSPRNFDGKFWGRLTAADALQQSLNVPAILVAEGIGLPRCVGLMQSAGLRLPANALSHGGCAIAVGGVEVTLLDLTAAYATLGCGGIARTPRLFDDEPAVTRPALDADVCAAIDDILSSRSRRPPGLERLPYESVSWFMWKTGTSSGRRDAWAVGHNRRFAVGVWVGRFSGRGAAEFVGAEAAAPLLARLFQLPLLRADGDPAPAVAWTVEHPLPAPPELRTKVMILAPRNGTTYVATDGHAIVHPKANRAGEVAWFLDDRLLENESAARLVLGPGCYSLRCVTADGEASAVRFAVKAGL